MVNTWLNLIGLFVGLILFFIMRESPIEYIEFFFPIYLILIMHNIFSYEIDIKFSRILHMAIRKRRFYLDYFGKGLVYIACLFVLICLMSIKTNDFFKAIVTIITAITFFGGLSLFVNFLTKNTIYTLGICFGMYIALFALKSHITMIHLNYFASVHVYSFTFNQYVNSRLIYIVVGLLIYIITFLQYRRQEYGKCF